MCRYSRWRDELLHRDYSHRSLIEKLGVRPEHRVCIIDVTSTDFTAMLNDVIEKPPAKMLRGTYDIIFLQVDSIAVLQKVARAAEHVADSGVLWIIHPKGKGASPHDAQVREAGLATGLVDNKISSYDATHTATRYVHRKRS